MSKVLKTILCVDDEPDILELTTMCLESVGGYQVAGTSSGKEGIAKAREIMPDLITLDMMMPGMDGRATLAAIRAEPDIAHIPVIFMTARVQPSEVDEYLKDGAIGVIVKPFDPMQISNEILKVWEKAN